MVTILGPHPVTGQPIELIDRPPVTSQRKTAPPGAASLGVAADGTRDAMKLVIRFAQLNVIDSDGDVTLPGAFPSKSVLISSWGHGSWEPGQLPVGRGTIREEGVWAVFRGQFFNTPAGREHYATFREARELLSFSYGYRVLDSEPGVFEGQRVRFLKKLDVWEVSGVMRGAGVATGLVETSGVSPLSLQVAAAALENDSALAGLTKRTSPIVGFAPDGKPIRLAGIRRATKGAA